MINPESLTEKVNDDRTLLEYIAQFVPLYHEYKKKDLIREIDALIREHLHSSLQKDIRDLRYIHKKLVNSDFFSEAKSVESAIIQTDMIAKKILHAKQGYSAIWGAIKVGKPELTKLMHYDAHVLKKSFLLSDLITKAQENIKDDKNDECCKIIEEYSQYLITFEDLIDGRDEVILGFNPSIVM